MSLILAAALAASPAASTCSWNAPGHNPYMGTMAAAVDRYTDIPAAVRERLKARMARQRYDEMVAIRRDSITGHGRYGPELRDMHFGEGQVCARVERSKWSDKVVERGLVYCEDTHCLVVPTVCRNVSRITRLDDGGAGMPAVVEGPPPGGTTGAAPGLVPEGVKTAQAAPGADDAPDTELDFAAPSAGPSFTEGAQPPSTAGAGSPGQAVNNPGPGGGFVGQTGFGPGWSGGGSGGGGGGGSPPGGHGGPGAEPGPDPADPLTPPDPVFPAPPVDPTRPWGPERPLDPGTTPPGPLVPPSFPLPPTHDTPTLIDGPLSPIPEAGTGLMAVLGALGLAGWLRRRRASAAHAA